MSLSDIITNTPPRESAGSETAKRYDYQKDLCLFMLIDLHDSGKDFVMLLDYFDDIALLDSDTHPQKIKFYQVKTKGAGHWLIRDFINAEDGKLSILGKMYSNKIKFGDYTESLHFITNASIKIDLPEDNKDTASLQSFCADEFRDKVIDKVNEHLHKELGLAKTPQFEKITHFKVHQLSLTDSATHCIGALNTLFEKLNPNFEGNVSLAYKKIFNEIKIKTSKTFKELNLKGDFSAIIREKGITKQEFAKLLEAAGLYKNPEQIWSAIHIDLAAAGAGAILVNKLKSAWRDANVKTLNQPNNIPLIKTIEHIRSAIELCLRDPANLNFNIVDLTDKILSTCQPLPYNLFDEQFIKGMILKELYND
jgi:hypothetical protein